MNKMYLDGIANFLYINVASDRIDSCYQSTWYHQSIFVAARKKTLPSSLRVEKARLKQP